MTTTIGDMVLYGAGIIVIFLVFALCLAVFKGGTDQDDDYSNWDEHQ